MNQHIGSDFDDFLREQGALEEATAIATKRVLSWQLAQAMKEGKISKTMMARRMQTSRAVVDRLLDAEDTGVTLATMTRASLAVGRPLRIELYATTSAPNVV
jgi:hypothetical protein